MENERRLGVFLHSIFPIPGWGGRDMGHAGWKGFIDWARSLGYNSCVYFAFPQHRLEDPLWTLPERRRLYNSFLAGRPPFGGGDICYEKDPLMATPEVRFHEEVRREAVRYAAKAGVRPRIGIMMTLGGPTFSMEHPEYQAVCPGDFCQETLALRPTHREVVDHLMDLWGTVVQRNPDAESFMLWPRDPGGFEPDILKSNPKALLDLIRNYYDMIRSKNPAAGVVFAAWGIDLEEIPAVAKALPKDVAVTEPPLIHSQLRTMEQYAERIKCWQEHGIAVETWLEVQENPTILLPSAYPQRIERAMRVAQSLGVHDHWACSSFYTYVFTLNFHVVAELARDPNKSAEAVTEQFLCGAYGDRALPDAKALIQALEQAWTHLYAPSQHRAGFNWPWHMVFAAGLLPEKLLREPVPKDTVEDIQEAVHAAEKAVECAELMSRHTWKYHPIDTNVMVVSTKLIWLRAQFRQAKLPLLEAIRTGDLTAAVAGFRELTRLAREMAATAACAPNTMVLNTHWTKLALLPEKLEAIRLHLPELVRDKRIRPVGTP